MPLNMPPNLVSFESVSRTCHEISQTGIRSSVRKVTEGLGGGSPNQIAPLLKRWHAEQPSGQAHTRVVIDSRIGDIFSAQILEAVSAARLQADVERDIAYTDVQLLSDVGHTLECQAAKDAERMIELEAEHLKDVGMVRALRDEFVLSKIEMSKAGEVVKNESANAVLLATKIARDEREKAERLNIQAGNLTERIVHLSDKLSEQALQLAQLGQALGDSERTRYAATENASVAAARLEAIQLRVERAETQLEKLTDTQASAAQDLHQSELQVHSLQLKNQSLTNEIDVARLALVQASEPLKPAKSKKSGAETVAAKVTDHLVNDMFDALQN